MPKHPQNITPIQRRDGDFENTNRGRVGGSSYSSGVFRERATGNLWLAKADYRLTEAETEGIACKEKIASDIYAFYGVTVPKSALARLPITNSGVDDDQNVFRIHFLSEMLDEFNEYNKQTDFSIEHLLRDGCVQHPEFGEVLEQGLGRVLAVAAFISDTDVVGSGANIGYRIEIQANGEGIAKTIKIDPGAAFDNNPEVVAPLRHIRVALQAENTLIAFDDLDAATKEEFILTLHDIMQTSEEEIAQFFSRDGAHHFLLHDGRTVRNLTDFLLARKVSLRNAYRQELQATLEQYHQLLAYYNSVQAQQLQEAPAEIVENLPAESVLLNQSQLTVIEESVNVSADAILFDFPDYVSWLERAIRTPVQIDDDKFKRIFNEGDIQPLLDVIRRAVNDDGGYFQLQDERHIAYDEHRRVNEKMTHIYAVWNDLKEALQHNNADQIQRILTTETLPPNYNPHYLIDLSEFDAEMKQAAVSEGAHCMLMRLREAFLEMTPMHEYRYSEEYQSFSFRIGSVPFNLDQCGPRPAAGIISEQIARLLQRRLENFHEFKQQHTQVMDEKEQQLQNALREQQEMKTTIIELEERLNEVLQARHTSEDVASLRGQIREQQSALEGQSNLIRMLLKNQGEGEMAPRHTPAFFQPPTLINPASPELQREFIHAIKAGNLFQVRRCVHKGAQVVAVDANGDYPLAMAIWTGNQKVFDYLFGLAKHDIAYLKLSMAQNSEKFGSPLPQLLPLEEVKFSDLYNYRHANNGQEFLFSYWLWSEHADSIKIDEISHQLWIKSVHQDKDNIVVVVRNGQHYAAPQHYLVAIGPDMTIQDEEAVQEKFTCSKAWTHQYLASSEQINTMQNYLDQLITSHEQICTTTQP